jgi:hypothetical protein
VGLPPGIDLSVASCPVRVVKRLGDPARARSIWILEGKPSAP